MPTVGQSMVKKPDLRNTMVVPSLLGVVMLVGFALSPVYGQSSNRAQQLVFPIDELFGLQYPCPEFIELIHVTGTMYVTFQVIEDAQSGRSHNIAHVNYANMKGEGVDSGTQYRLITSGSSVFNLNAGSQNISASGFQFIATGPDGSTVDVSVHYNVQINYNANGELTADITNFRTVCT
jgi:hypothetical protein